MEFGKILLWGGLGFLAYKAFSKPAAQSADPRNNPPVATPDAPPGAQAASGAASPASSFMLGAINYDELALQDNVFNQDFYRYGYLSQ